MSETSRLNGHAQWAGFILVAILAILVPFTAFAAEDKLTIGVIPALTEGQTQEGLKRLATHLESELERPVSVSAYPDYAAVVAAMGFGHIDMAYLGPRTYVIANHRYDVQAIVTQLIHGTPFYRSYFITRADSDINSIDQLPGRPVAFADPSSTSGSLIPKLELINRGIDPDRNIRALHTGAHDATAHAVRFGQVDAGAIDSAYFDLLVAQGQLNEADFKIIWQSEPLFQYPWAVTKDMPEGLVAQIQRAFLSIDDPVIFQAFGATGFTIATDADYDVIRDAARTFGDFD